MNVAGKDNIDLVLDQKRLVDGPHWLALHVMVDVAAVERRVHDHDEPRRLRSVHSRKLFLEPLGLRRVFSESRVRRKHDHISRGSLDRVPKRRRAPRSLVRHVEPVLVRLERFTLSLNKQKTKKKSISLELST